LSFRLHLKKSILYVKLGFINVLRLFVLLFDVSPHEINIKERTNI